MRISIFGMGYVGAVSGACFSEMGHDVVGVDTNPVKVDLINQGRSPIVEDGVDERVERAVASGKLKATTDAAKAVSDTDLSIISVGTPSETNGLPLLSIMDAVVADIGKAIARKGAPHAVVVRSTVLPGTTEEHIAPALARHAGRAPGDGLTVGFNPEFLREGTAVKDFYHPPFTVVGSTDEAGFAVMEALYNGIAAPFVRTSPRVAESVKYISNAYHALKICFANEIGALLKSKGMDSREAMRLFCEDRILNISPAYLRPGFAFGGSCLPKELRAIQSLARLQNVELPLLSQVLRSNDQHIDRAFDMIARHGRRKIAFFGLAFKPGTDDLRESPLVLLAERLIGKGYDLSIVDRSVEIGRLTGTNREFIEREIPHLERLLARDALEALEDAQTIVIGHAVPEDLAVIAEHGTGRTIIDLQGIEALEDLPEARYEGICW